MGPRWRHDGYLGYVSSPTASRFHATQVTGSGRKLIHQLAAGSFASEPANAERSEAWEGGVGETRSGGKRGLDSADDGFGAET